ncbi:MAG: hypothetical protein HYR88_04735 [Verrucomicrobia bacterium]|nr:hypothetical protein [Verrucomicrobiota bacterium]
MKMPSHRMISLRLALAALCLPAVVIAAAAAAATTAEPATEKPAEGWWRWTFEMPDGSKLEPRAKLKQEGQAITGVSIPRAGLESPISEGSIEGKRVRFSVVREENGRKATTVYSGAIDGDLIRGEIQSDWGGQRSVYPWEAKRVPATPAGKWKWPSGFGGNRQGGTTSGGARPGGGGGGRFENRATFAWDGKLLTGKITAFGQDTEITNGKCDKGEVSFDLIRDFRGEKTTTHFTGKLDGDAIKGQTESDFGGELRKRDWEATRVLD